jgi:hypothetical protein
MKQLFFLALFFTTAQLFGQAPNHFLITSDQQINITEPLCEDMIKETTASMEQYLKDIQKEIKKEKKELTLQQSSHLEDLKAFTQNVKDLAPAFCIENLLVGSYYNLLEVSPCFSLQKVQFQELGAVSVKIQISNIQISPSETSFDIIMSNPSSNQLSKSAHFYLPTGILLNRVQQISQMPYYYFWNAFVEQTKLYDWLLENISAVNPAILSPKKYVALLNEPIKNSKYLSTGYLEQARKDAQRILKEVPYPIPFDQINGILISQDESKIYFRTTINSISSWNQENYSHSENWAFAKKDNHWLLFKNDALNITVNIENEEDSLHWEIEFYRIAFDLEQTPWTYKEEEWTQIVDEAVFEYDAIEFKHVISSETNHQLIEQYIKPQLAKLLLQDTYTYNNLYQRQSAEFGEYNEEGNDIYTTTDFLISNPEQTAFIYPVLLHHKNEQEREYYYTNEDFKFYVLLKNSTGSYTLYDWHYFKTIPYKNYYNLTNCVESHLTNITDYNSGQEIINDTNFWNNYVFKNSARGYDYLIPMVAIDESIRISKNQFDAQVADCIDLIQQHDISDLYPNQLQQIIRCVNTIEKWNLQGAINDKLRGLSKELYIQNRINKVQENANGFYPLLNLEFKTNLNPQSYYILE